MRRRWKNVEESYKELIRRNYELEKFKGYASEVEMLRKSFIEGLPFGIEKVASLWADLNTVLDWMAEQTERKRMNLSWRYSKREAKGIKELQQYVIENKTLQYKLEYLEGKYVLALTLLKEKYGEDCVDAESTNYLAHLKINWAEEERERETQILEWGKKIKQLEARQKSLENNIERLNREKEEEEETLRVMRQQISYRVATIESTARERIALAKARMEQEDDIPSVLEKIANAWADYKTIIWERAIDGLLSKPRPISFAKAREYEIQLAAFKEKVLLDYKCIEYRYNYLISLFPELQEYIDGNAVREDNPEDTIVYEDRREGYLSAEEWRNLSEIDKSQLALDRYNEKRKRTKAQVGRDYEEYIGYLFREKLAGAEVEMFGEINGLADLGRDLIVKSKGKIYVAQCKRWAQEKYIREKHIMQLYGTTVGYCCENKIPLNQLGKSVIPVFVSTTEFSKDALYFAECLGVVVKVEAVGEYPQIKCNVGRDGEKIYHLPFDQQYNKVIIEPEKGEFYAWNVAEAERRGFRRARKYYNV